MNRLREIRKKHNKTQQDIANFLNLTPKAISFYEKGERDIPNATLQKLADFFHVSTDYLLGRDEEQPTDDIARILLQSEEKEKRPNRTLEMLRTYAALPSDKKTCVREYVAFLSNTCQNKQPIQQNK